MFGFGKKKKEIARLNAALSQKLAEIKLYEEELAKLDQRRYKEGLVFTEQPFIPEYIGFKETEIVDNDDILEGRVYHKDGINIIKPFDSETWILLSSDKKQSIGFLAKTMYHAILFFEAIGMDVSVEKYILQSENESEGIEVEL